VIDKGQLWCFLQYINPVLKSVEILVPVYNEENLIGKFVTQIGNLKPSLSNLQIELYITFIDDGSNDGTWNSINEQSRNLIWCRGIKLSRNFGKEAALFAGIVHANSQAIIPMDVDFQDPPELVFDLINDWNNGNTHILARRASRDLDSFFKRISAKLFYKVYNSVAEKPIPENVGDFRLMDKSVYDNIKLIKDSKIFMKEIFSFVGDGDSLIDFQRPETSRVGNSPSQSLSKLLLLAELAITSAGPSLFRKILKLTVLMNSILFFYLLIIVFNWLTGSSPFNGFATLVVINVFSFTMVMTLLALIGIVSSNILVESKSRPAYLVSKKTDNFV
jgi:glycosyltransferase involved in cell wall biosynthesis